MNWCKGILNKKKIEAKVNLCPNCENPFESGSDFCPNCGYELKR
ncbi:MAG: zinc-ribbon domain-containing protein [Asgard group archaeon]|nr:zinc-ribbon domain-containing protein [Asgard group archaeon]